MKMMMAKDLKGLALTWNCCVKASEVLYRSLMNDQGVVEVA